MQMARQTDIFLDSQFQNGSDGQLYEYEFIFFPTITDGGREGRKLPQRDDARSAPIRSLGSSNEDYRWVFLLKNNRAQDDYRRLIEFTQAMDLKGDEFLQTIGQVMDVDQWLRVFAFASLASSSQNYATDGIEHDARLYVRPSDGRVLLIPHDLDSPRNPRRSIVSNGDLRKLIADPGNEHMYYGHLHDMMQTTFHEQYLRRWIDHFGQFLPDQDFGSELSIMVQQSENALRTINRKAPQVDFGIVTKDTSVDTNAATLQGTGWVNVREIRLAGSAAELDVIWTALTDWQVVVPVSPGDGTVVLEAYDFQGKLIGTDQIEITSTATSQATDSLRITELNYNPFGPTQGELAANSRLESGDFEFIELTNIGDRAINLLGAHFDDGIAFAFPSYVLEPGDLAVVVRNIDSFRLRYDADVPVIGQFQSGRLSNGGERISLRDAQNRPVQGFRYDDAWFPQTDGQGFSLQILDSTNPIAASWSQKGSWQPSTARGGSPGDAAIKGDFNQDGIVDAADIDLLFDEMNAGTHKLEFDMTRDGRVEQEDADELVQTIMGTQYGDTNLDAVFDSFDLLRVLQTGLYRKDVSAGWEAGDWDGDGRFNSLDLVFALQFGGYIGVGLASEVPFNTF